jgi:hypothetical protein
MWKASYLLGGPIAESIKGVGRQRSVKPAGSRPGRNVRPIKVIERIKRKGPPVLRGPFVWQHVHGAGQ